MASVKQGWRTLPREVFALGMVSLFTDMSSDMIAPLLPAFLATLPGGGPLALGIVEGVAETISALLKLLSGAWADRVGRYKPFVVAGYTLAAIARPCMALAGAAWHVAGVRAVDRTGKGLRSSPRDALLAAAVEPERRGEAYGFHRGMDSLGATLGPLCAVLLLVFVTQDLRTIFWVATIPGVIGVGFLLARVHEIEGARTDGAKKLPWKHALPDRSLLRVLVPLAFFTLGNASDLFLLLKATQDLGSLIALPLLWGGLNLVKSITSIRFGPLVDRFGPVRMITIGWLYYALIYGALACTSTGWITIVLVIAYGVHHGLVEGAEKALIAGVAPPEQRGAWFGWYYFTVGILALPASVIFGLLWQDHGAPSAFGAGAALALLAVVLLVVLRPERALKAA